MCEAVSAWSAYAGGICLGLPLTNYGQGLARARPAFVSSPTGGEANPRHRLYHILNVEIGCVSATNSYLAPCGRG
jgi:hypothetical protein